MESANPLISVIMPLYNAAGFVEQAVYSVLNQTFSDLELIIVDDAGNDGSYELVSAMALRDSRIRLLKHDRNRGVAAARNTAIAAARGRYLAFLDSDDLWKEDRLSRQFDLIKNFEAEGKSLPFIFSSCEVIGSGRETAGPERHVPEKVDYDKLLHGNFIPCLTVLVDRMAFPEELLFMPEVHHEDYACWLRLLKYMKQNPGKTAEYAFGIDEILASYRTGTASASSNKFRTISWQWKILRGQEKLNIFKSFWYIICYSFNAVRKRVG